MKVKNEAFSYSKIHLAVAEIYCCNRLLMLHIDCGGEYMLHEVNVFLFEIGVSHQCPVPYTSQQNGIAKLRNRTLLEMA